MDAIWLWIIIAIVFGILSGIAFHAISTHKRKTSPEAKDNYDDANADISSTGSILLTIFVFSILAFLILWLVCAIMGVNMHW